MVWKSVTADEQTLFRQIMLWIRTVRQTGQKYGLSQYSEVWLPSDIDLLKSALLERIRSGLAPLDEPPPVGYACPWYALVEDAGPHYVSDVHSAGMSDGHTLFVCQNPFTVYERRGDHDLIVGDARGTSYRFRLWLDPEWTHPSDRMPKGGWLMQNLVFSGTAARDT